MGRVTSERMGDHGSQSNRLGFDCILLVNVAHMFQCRGKGNGEDKRVECEGKHGADYLGIYTDEGENELVLLTRGVHVREVMEGVQLKCNCNSRGACISAVSALDFSFCMVFWMSRMRLLSASTAALWAASPIS